ncbi:hypothetical protein J2T17_006345 [Paenibacillus mucilaginosus]|uniref:SMI1/KNR4 family protein n=1 Tax=Paenibacillus mucilaginosus TaxID=61624 RepID=UPI003D19E11B
MNRILWETTKEKPLLEHIAYVEDSLGIKFPQDYIENVLSYPGGVPHPNCFDDKETPQRVFGNMLNFDPTDENNYIFETYGDLKDYMPARVIPFASDPFGSCICFDYREDSRPTVVFWSRSIRAYELDEIDNEMLLASVTPICNSFTELLNILYIPE